MTRVMTTKIARRRKGAEHAQGVLEVLRAAGGPLSAYDIIASIGDGHDVAPATVYRALDRLIAAGQAHKLQSLNAYVACKHDAQCETPAFAICDRCGTVTEFSPRELGKSLAVWCRTSEFELMTTTLELHGVCQSCQLGGPS